MNNLSLLQEISILDRFKKHVLGGAKTVQEPIEEPDDPEGINQQHGESSLQTLLDKIFTVPSDRTRCVIFLNASDMKDRYLIQGGPASLTKLLDNDQLASTFKDANLGKIDQPVVVAIPGGTMPLTSIPLKPATGRPYAVLLNVPKNDAALLGKPVGDEAATRAALQKIIAHKNYIGVINLGAARKEGALNSKDIETQQEHFNVKTIVTAFSVRYIIDQAREEWDEVQNKTAKAAAQAQQQQAAKPSSVQDDLLQALNAAVSNAIGSSGIRTSKDIDKVTLAIKSVVTTNPDFKEYPGDGQKALKKLASDTSIGQPFSADVVQKLKQIVKPYLTSQGSQSQTTSLGDPQATVDAIMKDKGPDYAKSLLQILQHTLDKAPQ